MSKCRLDNGTYCEFFSDEVVKQPCVEGPCQAFKSAPTNADHIRGMSDEELAAFLTDVDIDAATLPFTGNWLDWIRQPWEGDADG